MVVATGGPGEELERSWKATCRMLLGAEIGPMQEYSQWLSGMRAQPVFFSKSSLSGKEVAYSTDAYCKGSGRISFDEIDFGAKPLPLPIDDIKDIDSLIGALSERFQYAGNVILGNSGSVERSSNVSDSFHVYESFRVGDSQRVAYSNMARLCDSVFGCAAPGESQYCIRCNDTYRVNRCFELWMSANCSDCRYVFNLNGCSDCMFSFNLRGKRCTIGNTALPKERYGEIRERLLAQMRDELVSKKRLASLSDLLAQGKPDVEGARKLVKGKLPEVDGEKRDMAPIEAAFEETTGVVLGIRLSPLSGYSAWLSARLPGSEIRTSALSGERVFVGLYANYPLIPKERTVRESEALRLVELSPPLEGVEKITLENAHEFLAKIGYVSFDYHDGTNTNVFECMAYAYSSNAFRCFPCVEIRDSAHNFWPRSSDHVFGCSTVFDSSFCINCSQSVKLSRCFEVDSSRDCAGCYYCHNCENVRDSMFCFNAKNLRYAIGNIEVGRERFLKAKEMLLAPIAQELARKKSVGMTIFNLACRK